MSTFSPGGSRLIVSTDLPSAFLEIAYILNYEEGSRSTADNPVNNVTITTDFETKTVAIAAVLPIQASFTNTGSIALAARDYLSKSVNFGNDSDLKTTSYPAAFLEVAQRLNAAEKAVTTQTLNNIVLSFDLEAQTATITASLPIFPNKTASGSLEIIATDYVPEAPVAAQ